MTARAKTAQDFISSPQRVLTAENSLWLDFQLATACGAAAAGWGTRVSLAAMRLAPRQILRQNGSTARATALLKPSAASSARRIWCSIADRSFGWKTGAGSAAR